jgi:hypothetical protein
MQPASQQPVVPVTVALSCAAWLAGWLAACGVGSDRVWIVMI